MMVVQLVVSWKVARLVGKGRGEARVPASGSETREAEDGDHKLCTYVPTPRGDSASSTDVDVFMEDL
jgi:hypothetical protein